MAYTVLIADDEPRMRILVSDFLQNENYNVIEAKNGLEAVDLFFSDQSIHLVILDVMMPEMDGWDACREIRNVSQVPIIMLTAKNTEADELTGFDKGSDEYITKPFSPSILVARVNALIKRTYGSSKEKAYGILSIDYTNNQCRCNDVSLELSTTEFKLLSYLIQNKNAILTRDQILDNVWGYDYEGTDRTVDSHMNRLRSKLQEAGNYIRTVRGSGYKFEVTK